MFKHLVSLESCPVYVKAAFSRISTYMFNNVFEDAVEGVHIMMYADFSGADICKQYGLGAIESMLPSAYVLHLKSTGSILAVVGVSSFEYNKLPDFIGEQTNVLVRTSDYSTRANIVFSNGKITYVVTKYYAEELILRDTPSNTIHERNDLFGDDVLTLYREVSLKKHQDSSHEEYDFEESD